MGDGIEDMDFDGKVEMGRALAEELISANWIASSCGRAFRAQYKGVHVKFSPQSEQKQKGSRDTIVVTYLSTYMGRAVHLFDHYKSLFGDSCDVSLIEDGSRFVKVED